MSFKKNGLDLTTADLAPFAGGTVFVECASFKHGGLYLLCRLETIIFLEPERRLRLVFSRSIRDDGYPDKLEQKYSRSQRLLYQVKLREYDFCPFLTDTSFRLILAPVIKGGDRNSYTFCSSGDVNLDALPVAGYPTVWEAMLSENRHVRLEAWLAEQVLKEQGFRESMRARLKRLPEKSTLVSFLACFWEDKDRENFLRHYLRYYNGEDMSIQ